VSLVVQKLRSAGWDPMNAGVPTVVWDDVPDEVSEITVFADLDEDGLAASLDEDVLIRHAGSQVVWRRGPDEPLLVVATNITNDSDGDGVVEDMFVPVSDPSPSAQRVLVQVTAQSPVPDPMTGRFIRYTVRSEVALRKTL
jgi:hypothetical protein